MTSTELIAHVEEAISRTLRSEAYMDADVLKITGFSTPTLRRLYSNLCHIDGVYAEAGLYAGSSVISAMNHSDKLHVFGFEDFSQSFHKEGIREELEANLIRYGQEPASLKIIKEDFFKTDLSAIDLPITIFNYDALHEPWAQRAAISRILPYLDSVSLITVDDFQWETVHAPTRQGFEDVSDLLRIDKEWLLSDGVPDSQIWHNGVALFCVSRIDRPST